MSAPPAAATPSRHASSPDKGGSSRSLNSSVVVVQKTVLPPPPTTTTTAATTTIAATKRSVEVVERDRRRSSKRARAASVEVLEMAIGPDVNRGAAPSLSSSSSPSLPPTSPKTATSSNITSSVSSSTASSEDRPLAATGGGGGGGSKHLHHLHHHRDDPAAGGGGSEGGGGNSTSSALIPHPHPQPLNDDTTAWRIVLEEVPEQIDFYDSVLSRLAGRRSMVRYWRTIKRYKYIVNPAVAAATFCYSMFVFSAMLITQQPLSDGISIGITVAASPVVIHSLLNVNVSLLKMHTRMFEYWFVCSCIVTLWSSEAYFLGDLRALPTLSGMFVCVTLATIDAAHFQIRRSAIVIIGVGCVVFLFMALQVTLKLVPNTQTFVIWRRSDIDDIFISTDDLLFNSAITLAVFCAQYCLKDVLRRRRNRKEGVPCVQLVTLVCKLSVAPRDDDDEIFVTGGNNNNNINTSVKATSHSKGRGGGGAEAAEAEESDVTEGKVSYVTRYLSPMKKSVLLSSTSQRGGGGNVVTPVQRLGSNISTASQLAEEEGERPWTSSLHVKLFAGASRLDADDTLWTYAKKLLRILWLLVGGGGGCRTSSIVPSDGLPASPQQKQQQQQRQEGGKLSQHVQPWQRHILQLQMALTALSTIMVTVVMIGISVGTESLLMEGSREATSSADDQYLLMSVRTMKFLSEFGVVSTVLCFGCHAMLMNRLLFSQLVRTFEFAFTVFQAFAIAVGLMDCFSYDWRCPVLISWFLLVGLALTKDVIIPTHASMKLARQRLLAACLAVLCLLLVWLAVSIYFFRIPHFRSRTLFLLWHSSSSLTSSSSSLSRSSDSIPLDMLSFVIGRVITFMVYAIPYLWALIADSPSQLFFIYGMLSYEVPTSRRRRKYSAPVVIAER